MTLRSFIVKVKFNFGHSWNGTGALHKEKEEVTWSESSWKHGSELKSAITLLSKHFLE